jgi:hypothetical protein
MKTSFYFAFFICLLFKPAHAQELLPFVENFTKSEYNGDNQVWNVVQGNDNALYFANNHYLLRYNGVRWERYSLPNKTIIRSLSVQGDRLYCGSYKEFGYWKRINGEMKYFSISGTKNLFAGNAENEEIWKIFRHDGSIYFQSFNVMYVLKGKAVEKIKFPSQISYCYPVGGKIYAASVTEGVYLLEGKKFTKAGNWTGLENNVIHGIEERSATTYVFTKNKGIFAGTRAGLKPWQNPLNETLKNDVILTAKFVDNNTLAIGTALKGLYIVDMVKGTYKTLNKKNVLKNNAVLSITTDAENDLWLGLDNGIAHVEVNSPVQIFTDNSGDLGSVYALSPFKDGCLMASNHGVFSYTNKTLNALPYSQGQVWDIFSAGSNYIIGHNDGTFIFNGKSINKANTVSGGWMFMKSDLDGVYFQAHYSGISVYKDINDLSSPKFLGITKPIRHIAQNRPGEIWAADLYRGLYRITYDKGFDVKKTENVSEKNNIRNDYGVKIFNFRDQLFFYLNNKWYSYNTISQKLEPYAAFNKNFTGISDIIAVDDTSFVVIKNRLLYLIILVDDRFIWRAIPEKYYQGKLIIDNTRVFVHNNKLYINLDDGFLAMDKNTRKVKEQAVTIEVFSNGELLTADPEVNYNQAVEINILPKYFGYNRAELFYTLNGEANRAVVKNGTVSLTNLASGSQVFEVFYNDGVSNKKLAGYKFHVLRPWYFSFVMVLVYILAVSAIFFLYYRWNKVRYMEKIKLNEEELRHKRKIMELEMEAQSKLRQQEHEKQMLEMEVQNKASEVAGKSLSIAKHSEMIESIQEALESDASGEQLKGKIRKIIKTNTISKNEWLSFEKNLFKSHEEFVNRLSHKYPSLTSKDIKLSIYLKMNLASKEIAPLMNISFRGVELHRYRLRKKIGVPQEESLTRFMINV